MRVTQRRNLLWLAALLVALGGVCSLLAGALIPVRIEAQPGAATALVAALVAPVQVDQQVDIDQPALDALERLARLCQRDLQPSLRAGPVAVAGDPAQPTDGSIRVIAAAHEPNRSLALLAHADGRVLWYAVGDSVVEGGRTLAVLRIDRRCVTLRDSAGELDLPMPKSPGAEP